MIEVPHSSHTKADRLSAYYNANIIKQLFMHVASCTVLSMPSRRIMGYCMGRERCVGELVRCVHDTSYSYGRLTNISPGL